MMNSAYMLQRCMEMMSEGSSMMGSGMMNGNPMSWILPLALVALLFVWVLQLGCTRRFGRVGIPEA